MKGQTMPWLCEVAMQLATQRLGRSLWWSSSTGSTQDDLRLAAEHGAMEGFTVVADAQQQGRGSFGKRWSSPAGRDLYLSALLRSPLAIENAPLLTLAVGLAVAECVQGFLPSASVQIKWPNDVLLEGRKCAGILLESMTQGGVMHAALVGIGLNVDRRQWPAELEVSATSLAQVAGVAFSRSELLVCLLSALERQVDRWRCMPSSAMVAALEARLAWRGEQVRCGDVCGELIGLSAQGALRLRTADGLRTLHSGSLHRGSLHRLRSEF